MEATIADETEIGNLKCNEGFIKAADFQSECERGSAWADLAPFRAYWASRFTRIFVVCETVFALTAVPEYRVTMVPTSG
jgi:hypothetical protein